MIREAVCNGSRLASARHATLPCASKVPVSNSRKQRTLVPHRQAEVKAHHHKHTPRGPNQLVQYCRHPHNNPGVSHATASKHMRRLRSTTPRPIPCRLPLWWSSWHRPQTYLCNLACWPPLRPSWTSRKHAAYANESSLRQSCFG